MKFSLALIGFGLMLTLLLNPSAKTHSTTASLVPDTPFDEYGNICWEDEKVHLDNFAIALQQNPDLVGYIVVYAGRRSCAGEAHARAERAKRWVVKRGIAADRLIIRDGEYRESVTTILQPLPKGKQFPLFPTVDAKDVEVITDCKDKINEPAKCHPCSSAACD